MCRIVLFGGTTEGRRLAEFLNREQVETRVCVATEYGGSLLPEGPYLTVSDERLDGAAMEELLQTARPELVVDATHPYATAVTENIKAACKACGVEYLRLLRQGGAEAAGAAGIFGSENGGSENCGAADAVFADSVEDAVAWLADKTGRILAATGSKELEKYTVLPDYQNRVVARVLSTAGVAAQCEALGFTGKNLICMQGPFSQAMNEAILRQYDCKYMVTKASGTTGGYEDKIAAALACGCTPVIIGRPAEEEGLSFFACKKALCGRLHLTPKREIALVGIGMGAETSMTVEAREVIEGAELVIGARRMVDAVAGPGQVRAAEYDSGKIAAYLADHVEYEKAAVVFSGDIGFYSGAKKLAGLLDSPEHPEYEVRFVPGMSSMAYFMGKIGRTWEDALLVSNHGRNVSLIPLVRDHEKVFSIFGRRDDVKNLAAKLVEYGLENVKIHVGEQLSYPEEKLFCAVPEDLLDYENDPLCVVLIENPGAAATRINPLSCRRDEEFLRDKVPMTKEDIRILSVSKLALTEDAVCYDVGAGTGSVSIEMAVKAGKGRVYAVEKKAEAVALLKKNKLKFQADNLEIIEGLAPDALADLPAPTHVFIGGSSGNMKEILEAVFAKNPAVRVVINCIAMETVAEALACAKEFGGRTGSQVGDGIDVVQVSVSRARKLGGYTMMTGENPITILSFGGPQAEPSGSHGSGVREAGEAVRL